MTSVRRCCSCFSTVAVRPASCPEYLVATSQRERRPSRNSPRRLPTRRRPARCPRSCSPAPRRGPARSATPPCRPRRSPGRQCAQEPKPTSDTFIEVVPNCLNLMIPHSTGDGFGGQRVARAALRTPPGRPRAQHGESRPQQHCSALHDSDVFVRLGYIPLRRSSTARRLTHEAEERSRIAFHQPRTTQCREDGVIGQQMHGQGTGPGGARCQAKPDEAFLELLATARG